MRRGALLASILVLVVSSVSYADTAAELDDAESRLAQVRNEIAEREATITAVQQELNAVAGRIETAESALTRTQDEITSTQAEIRLTEDRLLRLQEELGDRAAESFMTGGAESWSTQLESGSMSELSDRMQFLGSVAQHDADLAAQATNRRNELEVARDRLAELLTEQRDTLSSLESERAGIEARFAEQQAALEELDDLRAEAASLVGDLERRLDAEQAAPAPTVGGSDSPAPGADGVPGPLYVCPVAGPHAFADTFGQAHDHPGWSHTHEGNDIMAPYGTPIVAPFDGVASPGSSSTAGTYVTVNGSQGSVLMLHMSGLGQTGSVSTGDVVGYIGTSGNASGPHTHFEWHPGGGVAADPYPHLSEVC